jgi:hypothetical protein
MTQFKTLKKRGLKLLFCGAIAIALFGGARLGVESISAHQAPAHHYLACGGVAYPPCD